MTTSRREFLKAGRRRGGAVPSRPRRSREPRPRRACPTEPVKIGVIAIRAGIAAPVGTAGLRGTEWWADRVNKAGGILGPRGPARRRGGVEPEGHRRALPQAHPPGQGRRRRRRHLDGRHAGARAGGRGDGHAVAVLGRHHPEGRRRDDAQSQVGLQERGQRGRGHRGRASSRPSTSRASRRWRASATTTPTATTAGRPTRPC